MQVRNFVIVLSSAAMLASCKGGKFSLFKKKPDQSEATGWNYNDKTRGGFQVAKNRDQKAGPGLVFVEGGAFTMGQTDEDVLRDFNNIQRKVTVPSFYMDRTEVTNLHYREYMYWLGRVFDPEQEPANQKIINAALPDTLVWRSELSYNEPMVEYYFRHPAFNNYPVVGVTWRQANDYCLWRTDRVNEDVLVKNGFAAEQSIQNQAGQGAEGVFTTKAYLLGFEPPAPGKKATSRSNPLRTAMGTPRTNVTMEDGFLQPDYRLPTEAEWEYAAYGLIAQNPRPGSKNGKKRGEELTMNRQVYPWAQNVNGFRDTKHGAWQGTFLANFKRGAGDNAGIAGGLNDNAIRTSDVKTFYPNGYGLYNMAGNVSEWVQDVYRPLTSLEVDDVAPVRGNVFTKILIKDPNATDAEDRYEKDSMGRVKKVLISDSEAMNRRNYHRPNETDRHDGDPESEASYGSGKTTLISDKSRVYKGGSWNDRAYWMSPGTRRFLDEDQSSSTIGFRCAMDRMGGPEGKGSKSGIQYKAKKQKR